MSTLYKKKLQQTFTYQYTIYIVGPIGLVNVLTARANGAAVVCITGIYNKIKVISTDFLGYKEHIMCYTLFFFFTEK